MKGLVKRTLKPMVRKFLLRYHILRLLWNDYKKMLYIHQAAGSESHACAQLTFNYHRIEKGLTMPDFRPGFGKALIHEMIADLKEYERRGYHQHNEAYKHSVGVLHEYAQTHAALQFDLGDCGRALNDFLSTRPAEATQQAEYTKEDFFAHTHDCFPSFSASRHTIRHYAGRVPEKLITEAVELAASAPQACNRNFTRVHLYNGEKVQQILALQNGNRGFGHLCEQLIIVTADINALLFVEEWRDLRTNAGIFSMNLSYALHYKHVAHCILNLWYHPATDKQLRRIADIPENEVPVLCISCGDTVEHFKVASSPKLSADELLTVHPE